MTGTFAGAERFLAGGATGKLVSVTSSPGPRCLAVRRLAGVMPHVGRAGHQAQDNVIGKEHHSVFDRALSEKVERGHSDCQ